MDETLKIILGYVVFFVFMTAVMVVGEMIRKKTNIDSEMCRKGEHIATGLGWLIGCFFFGPTIHLVILNFLGFAVLGLVTFTGIMKSVERDDTSGKSYGLFYFGLSTFIVACLSVFVNNDFYILSGISYYCLVLGDGFAPITARIFKKINAKVFNEKTYVGAITVFVLSTLVTLTFSLVCNLNYSALFIISVGALAAAVEMFSSNCTDNITVEIIVFGYLVMQYFGLVNLGLQIAIIVSFPTAMLNGYKQALSNNANRISYVYLMLSACLVGLPMALIIIVLYLFAAVVGVVTTKIYNKRYGAKEKIIRKGRQILANSVVALALCVVYHLTDISAFMFAAFAVIAEEFADSMASDIGRLSKKNPVDIIGFKRLQTGISGGVSLLGSISLVVASLIALAVPFIFEVFNLQAYLILSAISVFGVFIDSVLGSRLQVLYKCTECGEFTEKTEHCSVATQYHKGIKWLDNSFVNLLSGAVTACLALCVFCFIV